MLTLTKMKIYSWLTDEENLEMNRRENPEAYEVMDKALEEIENAPSNPSQE